MSKLRKYASMLDVLPSALEGKLHLVTYVNRSIAATFTAMSAHNSQWRWCVPWPPVLLGSRVAYVSFTALKWVVMGPCSCTLPRLGLHVRRPCTSLSA